MLDLQGLARKLGEQPKYPVKINWEHPLSRGLVFFFFGRHNYVDNSRAEPISSPPGTPFVNKDGYALESSASTGMGWGFDARSVQALENTNQLTIGGDLDVDVTNNWAYFIVCPDQISTFNSPYGMCLGKDGGNNRFRLQYVYPTDTNGYAVFTGGPLHDVRGRRVIMVTRAGSSAAIYLDGALSTTATTNGSDASNHQIDQKRVYVLTMNESGTSQGTDGRSSWAAIWARSLSAAEVRSISRDPYQIFEPVVPLHMTGTGAATLYLRPDGDNIDGGWTRDDGGNTDLYSRIDEVTPSDADFIKSAATPATDKCKVSLSNPTGARDTTSPHVLKYRYYKMGTETIDLTVRLVQGASTTIATWTHTSVGGTAVEASQTLSGAQVSSITDDTDLYVEFEANAP